MLKAKSSKSIFFLPDQHLVTFVQNYSVLEVALANRMPISHSCGGMGTCGTCLIHVSEPELLSPRNEVETEMAELRGFAPHERLACQLPARDGLCVRIVNPELPDDES